MSYVTTDIAMKQKFRRYSLGIIAITFLVHFLQPALSTQTMNLFYTYLTQLHGWSRSEIALALTIASWVSIPGSFFFATLVIQYDPRLITALCIIGSGLCFLAIGRTSSYAVYLIAFILSYQFTRGMVLGGLQACTNWYISTRGRVLGIVTIGSPAASAVFANAVTRGIEATGSFSRVYTIIGVLVILLGILSAPLLRPAPEPLGLQPDGLPRSPEELARLKEFSAQTGGWNVKRLFTTKETWFLCVGWTCMFFVMTCFMTIFIPRMLEIGVDMITAVNYLSVSSLIGFVLSYLWGVVDDKCGAHKASIGLACGYLFMSIAMWLASGGNRILILIAVVGLASATGGMPNLNPSSIAYVYGRADFMANMRWIMMISGGLSAPASSVANLIYDATGRYDLVYLLCSFLAVVSIACFALIRKTYDPERLAFEHVAK